MKTLKQTESFTVYQPDKNGTFLRWFADILDVKEVDVEKTIRPRCFTKEQIDAFLKKENDLEMTGWGNYFPMIQDGEVSVVDARWDSGHWDRYRSLLGDDRVWNREGRLVLSNSDALNLDTLSPKSGVAPTNIKWPYVVCYNCGKIIRMNKFIVGSTHFCSTPEERQDPQIRAYMQQKYQNNKQLLGL